MPNDALVTQLLQWIGETPRGYRETLEAWRTSCPRLTIFEDAMSAGLIARIAGQRLADAQVCVTDLGRAHLGQVETSHA